MERAPMTRGARLVAVVVPLVLVSGIVVTMGLARARRPASHSARDGVRAPEGQRVRVQVLNATPTRGLARRATELLRDRGFDVVEMGTAPEPRDSTLVLDRSGHPDWANRVASLFGGARVETRADSSRYLDVTVLVGATWRPPAEPFYP